MIIEFADIEVKPGTGALFIAAVEQARPLFDRAEGCLGVQLLRYVDTAEHFTLVVKWETVEHHTEKFSGSADWQSWRALVSDYFAGKPKVNHADIVME